MNVVKEPMRVGLTVAGNPIDIFKYTLRADTSGPKVYVQSGIHGGEITYWIIHRLFNTLKTALKAGEVTIIPFANPLSWEQTSYFYTHGKFDLYDGKDFNRHFPGKSDGSMPQRIAHCLHTEALKHELVIDLHTSRDSLPFVIFNKMDYAPHVREIGLAFNYYYPDEDPSFDGSLDCAMDAAGIDNVVIECGGHDEYDEDKINRVYSGILRALARLGMVDMASVTDIIAPDTPQYFETSCKIHAQHSGFIRYDVATGMPFKKGDRLFTLFDTSELGIERVQTAPEDGIIFKRAPTHIYKVGDETLHYIPASALKPL